MQSVVIENKNRNTNLELLRIIAIFLCGTSCP